MLARLARADSKAASGLYMKLAGSWGHRLDRQRTSIKITRDELTMLEGLRLPEPINRLGMVQCGWVATYRHPTKRHIAIVVYSLARPPKRKSFTIKGGKHKLVREEVEKLQQPTQEAASMATKPKPRTRKPKVEDDELDELEALDDLDDLEDEDEEDEEDEDTEDEDEDEDDEDEEDEPPAKSRKKTTSKKAAPAKAKRSRKAPVEDDDEDEEDEDDEPAPAKRKAKSSTAKSSKAKSADKKAGPSQAIPKGHMSIDDLAEATGKDQRAIRIYLRGHADEYEKPAGQFRWSFGKQDFNRLTKALKKSK